MPGLLCTRRTWWTVSAQLYRHRHRYRYRHRHKPAARGTRWTWWTFSAPLEKKTSRPVRGRSTVSRPGSPCAGRCQIYVYTDTHGQGYTIRYVHTYNIHIQYTYAKIYNMQSLLARAPSLVRCRCSIFRAGSPCGGPSDSSLSHSLFLSLSLSPSLPLSLSLSRGRL